MVVANSLYTSSRYRALFGEGYDGVVRISVDGYYGSGVLLYGGRAVLTAAHLFNSATASTSVHFETVAGSTSLSVSKIELYPYYDSQNSNNDLAIVWLSNAAPILAERYEIYRDTDEIGHGFTAIGYGTPGVGISGTANDYRDSYMRLKIENTFEADPFRLKSILGNAMSWSPAINTQLAADFDDGTYLHDAFGRLLGMQDIGLGAYEGMVATGDSGGPAFIDGKIAGIASYVSSLSTSYANPDIDYNTNSSYGEIGFWQRIASYQEWIDKSIRANYSDAPASRQDIEKSVSEGNSGTKLAYFLVEFGGIRMDAGELSIDYRTRDGSAKAGEDYIGISGRLNIYKDETKAVIAVEILGDTQQEEDEMFYLDISNPIGGHFADNTTVLSTSRTILNDDGIWLG